MNDRRLLKPLVRRPGGTEWQDISWDDAISEIATRVKKTRDETFIEKDAAGHTVNRLESVAWIGGCTDTNEFNYLVVKSMRALGSCTWKTRPEFDTAPRSQVWDQRSDAGR